MMNQQTLKVHNFENSSSQYQQFGGNSNSSNNPNLNNTSAMLNFDYSTMLDNKVNGNDQYDIAIGQHGIFQANQNMDDSLLSSTSDLNSNNYSNSSQYFKSNGIKQLMQSNQKMCDNQLPLELHTSSSQVSIADQLIEQSRKRIQDIQQLMQPPQEVMNSYLKKDYNVEIKPADFEILKPTQSANISSSKNPLYQKSTNVMEDELKTLQDKILDLENKLCVTSTTAYSYSNEGSSMFDTTQNKFKRDKFQQIQQEQNEREEKINKIQQLKKVQDMSLGKKIKVDINLNNIQSEDDENDFISIKQKKAKANAKKAQDSQLDISHDRAILKDKQTKKSMSKEKKRKVYNSQTPQRNLIQDRSRANKLNTSASTNRSNQSKVSNSRFNSGIANKQSFTARLQKDQEKSNLKNPKQIKLADSRSQFKSKERPQTASVRQIQPRKDKTLMDITNTTIASKKEQRQEECVQSNYKEIASKVVDLQRQIMSLRGKLKMKETVEQENEKLKEELAQIRSKMMESEKKKLQYKEQVQEYQLFNEKLLKENKGLKEEIGELVMGKKVAKQSKTKKTK
ncbi:UNKNOWN [Stylonychia lemnae]|uniref:Uncharacterized protein n=1 Tax=Stylonychia lemnae TaxID=5949 RepID=A0A078AKH8_STYLE|nr:UNKNOWN [Stylonychia lemnae]|eukprot:CDW81937.1 UNKNOWN [Stylonychia lemnae]